MSSDLVPIPSRELSRAGMEQLPAAIGRAGETAAWRFIEFFTATIRNKNTRAAYAEAVGAILRLVREAPRPHASRNLPNRDRLLYREPSGRAAHGETE